MLRHGLSLRVSFPWWALAVVSALAILLLAAGTARGHTSSPTELPVPVASAAAANLLPALV